MVESIPLGKRDLGNTAQYSRPSLDPSIVPDRCGPVIEGYFRLPPIWVGDGTNIYSKFNPQTYHEFVFEKKLSCGILVKVSRDGSFYFDFAESTISPPSIIPGYTIPPKGNPHTVPADHTAAYEQAEENAALRACIMNVHQACMVTAETKVKNRSRGMGFPVTAWDTEKYIDWNFTRSYTYDSEDIRSIARLMANNLAGQPNLPIHRPLFEIEIIEKSFDLLDNIITPELNIDLLSIAESIYISACRVREKRFGEAIVLVWTAKEQMIEFLWRNVINSRMVRDSETMTKKRRDKLLGRDYTASIKIEFLELQGEIQAKSYRMLEISRRARNAWAHELRLPKQSACSVALECAYLLFEQISGVGLRLQSGGRGGVPQWPVWCLSDSLRSEELRP